MATYKMVYLNARGRGEILRLLFAYKGIEFEDVRIPIEDLQTARQESPFGILPVLHTEGKVLSGSGNIARYLGESFGLAGTTPLENTDMYGVMDAIEMLWGKFSDYFFEKDAQRKEELKKNLLTVTIPGLFVKLDLLAGKSTSTEGWIFNKLTYVDFGLFALLDTLAPYAPDGFLTKFPNLKRISDNIQKIDQIAKYLSVRPQSV